MGTRTDRDGDKGIGMGTSGWGLFFEVVEIIENSKITNLNMNEVDIRRL